VATNLQAMQPLFAAGRRLDTTLSRI